MTSNISEKLKILPTKSFRQYSGFLTYDAESMAQKLSIAYPVKWKSYIIEAEPVLTIVGYAVLIYQMLISEGKNNPMILITPYTANNIFSDHLDFHGEGFHHICIIIEESNVYNIALEQLLKSGFVKIQNSLLSDFKICFLRGPDTEFILQLICIVKITLQ